MYSFINLGRIQKNRTTQRSPYERRHIRRVHRWRSLHCFFNNGPIILRSYHEFCRQGSAGAQQLSSAQSSRNVNCGNYARRRRPSSECDESRKSSSWELCRYRWIRKSNSIDQRGSWAPSHSPRSLRRHGNQTSKRSYSLRRTWNWKNFAGQSCC